VYIPLKANTYAEKLEGRFLDYCQVVEDDGKIEFRIIKELKKKEYVPVIDEIAILGLRPLFATDKGDLFGRNFFIVIEKLDFRSPELSKRMNRMIQNFGKRYIKEKLQRLQELYGIEVVEINPAYTSQECSCCGYIDKKNRKDTQEFECKVCGNKMNAQINGAKNISKRSSLGNLTKKQVLKILIERYLERLKGCKSAPLDVIGDNPYFKDYLDSILNPRQSLTPS
jgi:transposase, IS605 OrfB family, central region